MGKTCHLPGTRNQLQGNRGTGEIPTNPEMYHFGLGRNAIETRQFHNDQYAQSIDFPEINDSQMKNTIRYLQENNTSSRGKVFPQERIALGVFSSDVFSGLVSRIIEDRDFTNTTKRHRRKHSIEISKDIKQSFDELLSQDVDISLALIAERTREALRVDGKDINTKEDDEPMGFVVDPGVGTRLVGRIVLLRSRYLDNGDGILRAQLDLSDRETRNGFEEDTSIINEVLDKAGFKQYRFIFDELDSTIPLFQKAQRPQNARVDILIHQFYLAKSN